MVDSSILYDDQLINSLSLGVIDQAVRHSSMSSSEPEWDTVLVVSEDVPSPAVYIDILTTSSPATVLFDSEWGTAGQDLFKFVVIPSPVSPEVCGDVPQHHQHGIAIPSPMSPEVYRDVPQHEQHIVSRSAVQSPTRPATMIKVITSSSSGSSEDDDPGLGSERCVAEQDMLDGGQYIVMSFMEDGSYGTVARAINTRTCDMVAIKIIKKRKNYQEVAEHEVSLDVRNQIASRLHFLRMLEYAYYALLNVESKRFKMFWIQSTSTQISTG